ncbi:MAG: hypothetical protein AAGI68_10185 [Planctomycetota bacterium]
MAIRLIRRRSTFNTFESFSDLVFCTLVLFLVVVMAMALNLGEKAEAVAVDEAEVAERRAELATIERGIANREAQALQQADTLREQADQLARLRRDASARSTELDQLRLRIDQQRTRMQRLMGVNRFTDRRDPPRWVVAHQWSGVGPDATVLVHPVPRDILARSQAPAGLSEIEQSQYFSDLRAEFLELASTTPGLTPAQYRAFRNAISQGRLADGSLVDFGEAYRTDLTMVVSGAVHPDYTPKWTDPDQLQELFRLARAGAAFNRLWDDQQPAPRGTAPGQPALRFSVQPHPDAAAEPRYRRVAIADQTYSVEQFRLALLSISGGLVLEYDPPPQGDNQPPAWLRTDVLRPAGFIQPAPAPAPPAL